jgi:hypothetical protein
VILDQKTCGYRAHRGHERARELHKCAMMICDTVNGVFVPLLLRSFTCGGLAVRRVTKRVATVRGAIWIIRGILTIFSTSHSTDPSLPTSDENLLVESALIRNVVRSKDFGSSVQKLETGPASRTLWPRLN